jgi:hypothetical protein
MALLAAALAFHVAVTIACRTLCTSKPFDRVRPKVRGRQLQKKKVRGSYGTRLDGEKKTTEYIELAFSKKE